MLDVLRVGRLIEAYWPFERIFDLTFIDPSNNMRMYPPKQSREEILAKTLQYEVASVFVDFDSRDDTYHWGRIRFFYDQALAGKEIDPIEVDNECSNGRIYPEPVLIEGHHRLSGMFLANSPTIRAFYSGRVDLLRWLQGKRKHKPEY